MALVTATVGASLYGAHSAKQGAKKQAAAVQHGADQSIAEQRRQFDATTEMQRPWMETGGRALGALEKIYGIQAPAEPVQQPPAQSAQTMQQPVKRQVRRGFR